MNFALVLSGNRVGGTRTDWARYLSTNDPASGGLMKPAGLSATSENGDAAAMKEKKLEALLLVQPVSEHTRETVIKQFQDTTAQQEAEKNFPIKTGDPEMTAGALLGSSMAQPNRPRAVAMDQEAAIMAGLLLGSPEFQRR
jgi:hypothetical protein